MYYDNKLIGDIGELHELHFEEGGDTPSIPVITDEASIEFDIHIPRNSLLSILYNRRITNNWLKMHGGIMRRNRAFEKLRKTKGSR